MLGQERSVRVDSDLARELFGGSMVKNGVCAVIVTFRPQAEVLENLAAVRRHVEAMVVVDNGSTEDRLSPLREAARTLDFILIENGRNLGLPAALNIGMAQAERLGFHWLCLFVQDSGITDGFFPVFLSS